MFSLTRRAFLALVFGVAAFFIVRTPHDGGGKNFKRGRKYFKKTELTPVEFDVFDDSFNRFLPADARLERLYEGALFSEGPAYFPDGDFVVWSDIPNNRLLQWSPKNGVEVFREPSFDSNGNARDGEGRLVTCEHAARRLSRTHPDGTYEVLVDRFDGKRFNSPNDLAIKSDGSIWFSDPPYGLENGGRKIKGDYDGAYLFRFQPDTREVTVVADDFLKPNGVAFSPDEKTLYITDTGDPKNELGKRHIRAFDVMAGEKLANGRVFAQTPRVPDGLRTDSDGNVWVAAGPGIYCYSPEGKSLGRIVLPENAANCEFGGPGRDRLFITATSSLYAIRLNRKGA